MRCKVGSVKCKVEGLKPEAKAKLVERSSRFEISGRRSKAECEMEGLKL